MVHPVAVEIPRSMSMVATNWNLPMHKFLKNCEQEGKHMQPGYELCLPLDVYKPSRRYLGQFGAVLLTFSTSALLHVSVRLSTIIIIPENLFCIFHILT